MPEPVSPNTTYKLNGWMRSPDGATAEIGVKDYRGSQISDTSISNTWTQKNIEFTTGSGNTSATIYFKKASGETSYFYYKGYRTPILL